MNKVLITVSVAWISALRVAAGLTLWSGNANDVSITGNNAEIFAAGTFKFESVTAGELDIIGEIKINGSVNGIVTIYVERSTDNDSPGATDVRSINPTLRPNVIIAEL